MDLRLKKLAALFRLTGTLFILIIILCLSGSNLWAQEYGRGLEFDDEIYSRVPLTATLTTRSYKDLPRKVSLQKYAPTPGSQGRTGTCVAWSTAYHGRTMLESIRKNRTNLAEINENTFSPSYVYNQIRRTDDCSQGTSINQALNLIQNNGLPKFSVFGFDCHRKITSSVHEKARPYRIMGYKRLHTIQSKRKVLPVKKSLSESRPVVFGMLTPDSFYKARGVWKPQAGDYDRKHSGHAMVVVGYDDDRSGGSFLIINSWGTRWGDRGFMWITYKDYDHFAKYSYEMIDRQPERPPMDFDLSGELVFKETDGPLMKAHYDQAAGMYRMDEAYTAGTGFRLYISNNEPAYVYAFGSDLTRKSFRIFPHQDGISPYLGYKGSGVAIPDEDHYIRVDETPGRDYFCVLYSKGPLNFISLMREVEKRSGGFAERLSAVLGPKFVSRDRIRYVKSGGIRFKASSGDKMVVPIIVEFIHN